MRPVAVPPPLPPSSPHSGGVTLHVLFYLLFYTLLPGRIIIEFNSPVCPPANNMWWGDRGFRAACAPFLTFASSRY